MLPENPCHAHAAPPATSPHPFLTLSPLAEAGKSDLKGLVNKFIPEAISKEIEKACAGIYPLQNVFIRKVKTIKAPKFDLSRLLDFHDGPDGAAVKPAEAPLVESLEGSGGRL